MTIAVWLYLHVVGAVVGPVEAPPSPHVVEHLDVGAGRVGLLAQRQHLPHQHAERPVKHAQ